MDFDAELQSWTTFDIGEILHSCFFMVLKHAPDANRYKPKLTRPCVGMPVMTQHGSTQFGIVLVGYNVVTSGRRNVGKVRGYTFNINSGAVESLELDSFGMSIIPASLVSTYCLLIEDVLDVVADTVIVHEGAVSRVQRLTKGIWDARSSDKTRDEIGEYFDYGGIASTSRRRTSQKNYNVRKSGTKMGEREDDWELPMDY